MGKKFKIYHFLLPLSWLYEVGVWVRNFLYKHHFLKRYSFNFPVICMGNISVGGTGKTPHTEYLISFLQKHYKVAVLSRGYKRKLEGFVEVKSSHTAYEVGDEPLQIKLKYPSVIVAVDKDRKRGINTLKKLYPEIQVVLLDDGFQHLRIRAGLNLVLLDYNRFPTQDCLLPAGRLREPFKSGKERADIFIVTKIPIEKKELDENLIRKEIAPLPCQQIFFSSLKYKGLQNLESFQGSRGELLPLNFIKNFEKILLLTGIASPQPMIEWIKEQGVSFSHLQYPDHHHYTKEDILQIKETFQSIKASKKIILTTEKDIVRLKSLIDTPTDLYALIMEVEIGDRINFERLILKEIEGMRK